MKPILSLENVSKYYVSQSSVVMGLNNARLNFQRGEFVAITGESGSGKTTLSKVIAGILGYESGEMRFDGKPTSHYDSGDWERFRRDNISYISQDYGLLPGCSVLGNVITALRLVGVERAAAKERAREVLQQLELWPLRHRRASRLSSGQKQRLAIARALAKPAPVLIADEPTGNLDPENSAKVISLLAKAAETRLVLIVTHEFDEVKDHATRHIRLQDGSIVVDAPLHPALQVQETAYNQKKKVTMAPFVAGQQLRSRPIWSMLMTLLFTLTAFAIVAFLGTFVSNLDDTFTYVYDPSAFPNGSPERIVVSRTDQKPLTQQDYEAIIGVRYACALERNGYVTDAQYAYRDGVDFTTKHTKQSYFADGNIVTEIKTTYHVKTNAPFVQTVPVLPEGEQFLSQGSLPGGIYEVVAHTGTGFAVGDTVKVLLRNALHWPNSAHLELDFKVTGLTQHGEGLYFHDDLGRYFQHVAHISGNAKYYQFLPMPYPENWREIYSDIPEEYMPPEFDYTLSDSEGQFHESVWVSQGKPMVMEGVPNINLKREGKNPLQWSNLVVLSIPQQYYVTVPSPILDPDPVLTLGIPVTHETLMFTNLVFVSQSTFNLLCWNEDSEQASLIVEDYAYVDRVIGELTELGYVAVSPYRLGSVDVDHTKAQQREQTLTICLLALLAVVALQIVLMQAMFIVERGSYQLLRNIGLVRRDAKGSVYLQFVIFAALGQLLTALALWVCWQNEIEMLQRILRYLTQTHFLALSLLHLLCSLLAAIWTVRGIEKQIYPVAVRFEDLKMEEVAE